MLLTLIMIGMGYLLDFLPFGLNAFFYGFINRLLNPFGLHSVMIPTFTYSQAGGMLVMTDPSGIAPSIKIIGDSAI
jgi:phosphotransferase system  glucose/maltose/N-acetylglucosamine-specific IIC component